MQSVPSFLGRALIVSLVLHAAVIVVVTQLIAPSPRAARRAQAELSVSLRDRTVEPVVPAPSSPQLLPPREGSRNASAGAVAGTARPRLEISVPGGGPAASRPASPALLQGDAAARVAEQLQRELLYPREAIERGQQGEALVLLFLDASGNVIAARLEASSGHALLDDAAVLAVRSLHALPVSAPREALLPVRFRLR